MKILVVNKHKLSAQEQKNAVYVGRGSPLGNPFKVKPWGEYERGETLVLYEAHLRKRLAARDSAVRAELNRIWKLGKRSEGVMIMCFCAPLGCHADVIKKIIMERA